MDLKYIIYVNLYTIIYHIRILYKNLATKIFFIKVSHINMISNLEKKVFF